AATRLVSWTAVAVLIGAGIALAGPASSGARPFDGLLRADAFATYAKVLIYVATAVSIIIAPGFFARTSGSALRPEYPVLMLLAAIGSGVMVSAGDMITLYVGLELQSLASYVLASFMRRDPRSAEAGLKYFVLGALASGILLYGISLVYGFAGSTGFDTIAAAFDGARSTGLIVGLVFVFAGLAFKIAAVPFHMWTPDVYEGAPTPVTAFFASASKVAAVGMGLRIALEAMGPAAADWRQIVIFASLASIYFGAIGAIGQVNIKRLLAYSSINNIGFALMGLAAATPAGTAAVLSYITVYVVMTLGSFLVVLQMRGSDDQPIETITSLSGLSRTRPGLAAALAIFMFSLAGIPPLLGFWPKLAVFQAATDAGLLAFAVFGAIGSVVGAFYYLKIIKTMYFDAPANEIVGNGKHSSVEYALIAVTALLVSPLGWLLIQPLAPFTNAAAGALF
ncbi:MAG: NADH-quinone oxidoreductase subunit NuoN, partial [Sphingomonadales bacterium]|nr:NADH-quinone oxidoreductase subunit NuoN [Sphingomonadales bacterium]